MPLMVYYGIVNAIVEKDIEVVDLLPRSKEE
jgi:hypothetical protein